MPDLRPHCLISDGNGHACLNRDLCNTAALNGSIQEPNPIGVVSGSVQRLGECGR